MLGFTMGLFPSHLLFSDPVIQLPSNKVQDGENYHGEMQPSHNNINNDIPKGISSLIRTPTHPITGSNKMNYSHLFITGPGRVLTGVENDDFFSLKRGKLFSGLAYCK